MKVFYKTLLVALFLPMASFAQSNYKPGYVVTLKGDTLKGVIDYREWNSNPDYIDFKNSIADSKAKRFTPEDIGYFEVSGLENYIRYSGHISMDATDKDHLSSSRDTSYREATVFFKVLQKGSNLALYTYTDELKTRFYVGEAPDFAVKELVYRLYYNGGADVSGQKGNTVTENAYMKQLFALANKYNVLNNSFQWDIEHAGYNSDDMLKIVSRINHMSKTDYKKMIASKGPIFNLFVSAGVNINNISSPASTGYSMGGGKSGATIGPAVSFGANFFANPSTQQLQFRVEIGATKGQFTSLYKLKVDPYVPFKVSFNETAFSIMPQVLYNFYNTENFKIYGDIGVAFNIYTFSNSYLGSQSQPNTAANITENEPFAFNNSDDTFLFKIGVQINKRLGIYAQYLASSMITTNAYFQMTQTGEQFGVNYFFK